MIESIEDNLQRFRRDIATEDNKTLVDRYYYSTSGPILTNEQQASLRRLVSDKFEISIRDVILVGSAKLGFTIRKKTGRPPLSHFGDQSDIDVAVVSTSLFIKYWQSAFSYWLQKGEWSRSEGFRKYLFRGWLRPDMLPSDPDFTISDEWFEFFRQLQATGEHGGFKIAAGIYLNEHFWEEYVSSALSECRLYVKDLA